jgi:hypothetical protein
MVSTYLGKCCANVTVSTSTVNVCPAKNSATSRRAKARHQLLGRNTDGEHDDALASLDNVVVYGCPPLAIRICNRVSLKSLPAAPLAGEVAEEAGLGAALVLAGSLGIGWPSRIAFSRANFSARVFLSASIWALMAAFARASSILSEDRERTGLNATRTR